MIYIKWKEGSISALYLPNGECKAEIQSMIYEMTHRFHIHILEILLFEKSTQTVVIDIRKFQAKRGMINKIIIVKLPVGLGVRVIRELCTFFVLKLYFFNHVSPLVMPRDRCRPDTALFIALMYSRTPKFV